MSKRFGRNQLRKLRQQVAAMASDVQRMDTARQMAEALAAHIGRKNRELEKMFQDTRKVLGNHFCSFPPSEFALDRIPPVLMLPLATRLDATSIYTTESIVRDIACATQYLDVILTSVEMDKIRAATHVRVTSGYHDQFGYALSREARMMMPKDVMIERLSSELAHIMAQEFKKERMQ